jgi:hypothetical protein
MTFSFSIAFSGMPQYFHCPKPQMGTEKAISGEIDGSATVMPNWTDFSQ